MSVRTRVVLAVCLAAVLVLAGVTIASMSGGPRIVVSGTATSADITVRQAGVVVAQGYADDLPHTIRIRETGHGGTVTVRSDGTGTVGCAVRGVGGFYRVGDGTRVACTWSAPGADRTVVAFVQAVPIVGPYVAHLLAP